MYGVALKLKQVNIDLKCHTEISTWYCCAYVGWCGLLEHNLYLRIGGELVVAMDVPNASAAQQVASSVAATGPPAQIQSKIHLNHSKMYVKDATISEIFGNAVKPGRELLEQIIKTYKAYMTYPLSHLFKPTSKGKRFIQKTSKRTCVKFILLSVSYCFAVLGCVHIWLWFVLFSVVDLWLFWYLCQQHHPTYWLQLLIQSHMNALSVWLTSWVD